VLVAADRPDLVAGLVLVGPFVRNGKVGTGQRLLLRLAMARPWAAITWKSYLPSSTPGDGPPTSRTTVPRWSRASAVPATRRRSPSRHGPATIRLRPGWPTCRRRPWSSWGEGPRLPGPCRRAAWIGQALSAGSSWCPSRALPPVPATRATSAAVVHFLGWWAKVPRAGLNGDRVVDEAERIADEVAGESDPGGAGRASRVRQPSLYKHIDGLAGLRRSISIRAKLELADVLARAAVGRSGGTRSGRCRGPIASGPSGTRADTRRHSGHRRPGTRRTRPPARPWSRSARCAHRIRSPCDDAIDAIRAFRSMRTGRGARVRRGLSAFPPTSTAVSNNWSVGSSWAFAKWCRGSGSEVGVSWSAGATARGATHCETCAA